MGISLNNSGPGALSYDVTYPSCLSYSPTYLLIR